MLTENLASAAVPTALSASILKAVHVTAAGGGAASAVSSSAVALSEGVIPNPIQVAPPVVTPKDEAKKDPK